MCASIDECASKMNERGKRERQRKSEWVSEWVRERACVYARVRVRKRFTRLDEKEREVLWRKKSCLIITIITITSDSYRDYDVPSLFRSFSYDPTCASRGPCYCKPWTPSHSHPSTPPGAVCGISLTTVR